MRAVFYGALASVLLSCASLPASRPYYLTTPARSVVTDSTVERIVVYVDERTMIWLTAMLQQDRSALTESGACLHIAERVPPDGYKVDSVYPSPNQNEATWKGVKFGCPLNAAPIHFHVLVPTMEPWLQSQGYSEEMVSRRCTLSDLDRGPWWSGYPFNAMSCGAGVDSLYVYRVKAR